jgi:hypothetical protein
MLGDVSHPPSDRCRDTHFVLLPQEYAVSRDLGRCGTAPVARPCGRYSGLYRARLSNRIFSCYTISVATQTPNQALQPTPSRLVYFPLT